jgi:hypothetical protein
MRLCWQENAQQAFSYCCTPFNEYLCLPGSTWFWVLLCRGMGCLHCMVDMPRVFTNTCYCGVAAAKTCHPPLSSGNFLVYALLDPNDEQRRSLFCDGRIADCIDPVTKIADTICQDGLCHH